MDDTFELIRMLRAARGDKPKEKPIILTAVPLESAKESYEPTIRFMAATFALLEPLDVADSQWALVELNYQIHRLLGNVTDE